MLRNVGAVALGGSLLSAFAAVGWPALLLIVTLAMMVVAATCWILNSSERPKRLAVLILAFRGKPVRTCAVRTQGGAARPTSRDRQ